MKTSAQLRAPEAIEADWLSPSSVVRYSGTQYRDCVVQTDVARVGIDRLAKLWFKPVQRYAVRIKWPPNRKAY